MTTEVLWMDVSISVLKGGLNACMNYYSNLKLQKNSQAEKNQALEDQVRKNKQQCVIYLGIGLVVGATVAYCLTRKANASQITNCAIIVNNFSIHK